MTFDRDKARLRIAQDLTAIEGMFSSLRAEAVNRAGDPDIPGGAAMVMLGPGADVEAWNYVQMSAALGRLDHYGQKDVQLIVKDDIEPPLSFLASWSDLIREERGQEPSTKRASIKGEADYIRSALDWVLATDEDGSPWWLPVLDFSDGLHKVRRSMENVLHDGDRDDKINARCKACDERRDDDDEKLAPRLSVRKAEGHGGHDFWQCPRCKQVYDEDGVRRCWRHMFVSKGDAPEWLHLRRAAAAVGRPVSTVRTWTIPLPGAEKARVESEPGDDGRTWVRWSDVRALDDMTRRRGKNRQVA